VKHGIIFKINGKYGMTYGTHGTYMSPVIIHFYGGKSADGQPFALFMPKEILAWIMATPKVSKGWL